MRIQLRILVKVSHTGSQSISTANIHEEAGQKRIFRIRRKLRDAERSVKLRFAPVLRTKLILLYDQFCRESIGIVAMDQNIADLYLINHITCIPYPDDSS